MDGADPCSMEKGEADDHDENARHDHEPPTKGNGEGGGRPRLTACSAVCCGMPKASFTEVTARPRWMRPLTNHLRRVTQPLSPGPARSTSIERRANRLPHRVSEQSGGDGEQCNHSGASAQHAVQRTLR